MAVGDPFVHPDAQATSDDLHFTKNKMDPPPIPAHFPPYLFRPYPMAMYRRVDGEIVSALVGVDDHPQNQPVNATLRDRNDREKAVKLEQGWATSPDAVKDAQEALDAAVRLAAAERAFDDRRLGDKARAELEAVEDAAEGHVLDVPAPKKKRGRKPKPKPAEGVQ